MFSVLTHGLRSTLALGLGDLGAPLVELRVGRRRVSAKGSGHRRLERGVAPGYASVQWTAHASERDLQSMSRGRTGPAEYLGHHRQYTKREWGRKCKERGKRLMPIDTADSNHVKSHDDTD